MATSEKTSSYRWVIEVLLVLALASQARGCPWALKLGLKTELELPVCRLVPVLTPNQDSKWEFRFRFIA
jgi:hypothetical protein